MRWLKKIFGKQKFNQIEGEQANINKAHQIGRDLSQSMVEDLDSFIASRFGHLKETFPKVLDDRLYVALSQDAHSPILEARIELEIYNENITDNREKMVCEIMEHMQEWGRILEKLDGQDLLPEVINKRLDDLLLIVKTKGIELLIKRADLLKTADDRWRKENPTKAEQEPL